MLCFSLDVDECSTSASLCDLKADCKNSWGLIAVCVNLDLLETEKLVVVCRHYMFSIMAKNKVEVICLRENIFIIL